MQKNTLVLVTAVGAVAGVAITRLTGIDDTPWWGLVVFGVAALTAGAVAGLAHLPTWLARRPENRRMLAVEIDNLRASGDAAAIAIRDLKENHVKHEARIAELEKAIERLPAADGGQVLDIKSATRRARARTAPKEKSE